MNNKNYGLNFNFITLRVKNIEKMRDYYLKLLKMKVLNDKKENGKREITLGTKTVPLIKMISFGNEVFKNDNETNVFHIAYLLPERKDLGNFLRNCAKELIKLDGVGDHNVSEAVYLTDPEGNGIEVYADRDSNTWKWENGYVIMGTETIDLEDLLKISDNLPDFEIPENTKIGHVHLETFNLENDKDFYIKALGLETVSKLPKAYFLSTGKYHHQFGMNQWNGKRKIPKNDNSTGVEEIHLSLVKEKFEKTFPNIKENTVTIDTPNRIKLFVSKETK